MYIYVFFKFYYLILMMAEESKRWSKQTKWEKRKNNAKTNIDEGKTKINNNNNNIIKKL